MNGTFAIPQCEYPCRLWTLETLEFGFAGFQFHSESSKKKRFCESPFHSLEKIVHDKLGKQENPSELISHATKNVLNWFIHLERRSGKFHIEPMASNQASRKIHQN